MVSMYYSNRAKWDRQPLEQRLSEIMAILDDDIQRWNFIKEHGCSDPTWPDGVNMNLVRNHVICDLRVLYELERIPKQVTFDDLIRGCRHDSIGLMDDLRIPPLVADDFMAKPRRCTYFVGRA